MSEYENSNNTDFEQEKAINNRKNNKKKRILHKYYSNAYLLENQALRTGFGKMIRAINQTNPKYSFGKEKRFFSIFKKDNLPYEHGSLEKERYGNINLGYHSIVSNKNKGKTNFSGTFNRFDNYSDYSPNKNPDLKDINFISTANNATDYYYIPPPTHYYKYNKSPKWKFGKSKRVLYSDKGKYEHYNLPYDRKIDNDNIKKIWRNHIIGGSIGLNDRFIEDIRTLPDKMETPGPGRYNPKDIYFKYNHYPGGYMGMKLDSCEPEKHKNLAKELNQCFNGNEKLKKSVGTNKNFVFHGKIKFDLSRNNYLNNSINRKFDKGLIRNKNEYIKEFRRNFSETGKKLILSKLQN